MRFRFLAGVLLACALGAPFVLVARAASALVAPLTEASVALLLRVSAPLSAARTELPPSIELDTDTEGELGPNALSAKVPPKTGKPAARGAPKAVPQSLFVSRATVLRLSQSAARPGGSFVGRTAQHPAGLRLSGVAPLGIGVQDGDILVEALGISPRSAGEIVGAVIQARAQHAAALSGTLWRHGQSFRITVEQPY